MSRLRFLRTDIFSQFYVAVILFSTLVLNHSSIFAMKSPCDKQTVNRREAHHLSWPLSWYQITPLIEDDMSDDDQNVSVNQDEYSINRQKMSARQIKGLSWPLNPHTISFLITFEDLNRDCPPLLSDNIDKNLHDAVSDNDIFVVQLLLAQGANPNTCDHEGYAPLHISILHEKYEIFIYLLTHGADPNLKTTDIQPDTPLGIALLSEGSQYLKLLLEHKANPLTQNDWGRTVLHIAADFSQFECVKVILGEGLKEEELSKRYCTLEEIKILEKDALKKIAIQNRRQKNQTLVSIKDHWDQTPLDVVKNNIKNMSNWERIALNKKIRMLLNKYTIKELYK